jgi:starch-binding outer membrane protein, SusD/RagB family
MPVSKKVKLVLNKKTIAMKVTHYITQRILLVLMVFVIFSCDKNLDIDPTQELESVYFETEERVQRGVGAAYAALTSLYSPILNHQSCLPPQFLPGDDIIAAGTGASLMTFSGLNSANGNLEENWKRLYEIVARCNFILERLEQPEIQAVYQTPGLIDANRGEMLFLRSWAFYRLWDWWRKAPIQDERITSIENAILPPSEGFQMLDNAIASLETAQGLLPASWDGRNLGRVTKDGANGLLVKLYVMRACYNNKSTEDYQKAITAFTRISASRQLVHYGENFDYRFENNAESLFEFQASRAPGQDNAWLDNNFGGDVGQMGAMYHMFTAHWGNYTTGIWGPSPKLINAYEPGDPRKTETLRDTANVNNMGGAHWWIAKWDRFGGHMIVKYLNGERGNAIEPIWSISSANNPRILRLADVKLAVAEAYLATGNPGEALKQVNDIRKRARESTPDGSVSAVPADLAAVTMEDIMHERFIELAAEHNHRWTDLRRWHAAGYIDLGTWTAAEFGFPYDPALFAFNVNRHLLFPIPNSEMDRNPLMAASGNNPGY